MGLFDKDTINDKERKLASLEVDKRISEERRAIAEQKALEKKMKKGEGKDWKKMLGVVKGLGANKEALQNLYAINPELKEMSKPGKFRRL